MKVVILAGGLGTRLSEETNIKPKPMVEIGNKPILWHIMKIYSSYGLNEFIICCGYKSFVIKEFFANYILHTSDVTFDLSNKSMHNHSCRAESWKVTLVDTGLNTGTGGRLKKVKKYIGDEDFCFTYGDGLADVNITDLIKFHKSHKKFATVTSVQPPGRFGSLQINNDSVTKFKEKPIGDGGSINGGFFVLSPKVIDYIDSYETSWELDPLIKLVDHNQLMAFRHKGFWQPMDTLRQKNILEELWNNEEAPWKTWEGDY